MEMPQIQYQPQQVNPGFSPVEQVDTTALMRQNQQRQQADMQAQLQQMKQNAAIEQENIKSQDVSSELAQFSKTLQGFLLEKAEKQKEEDINEGAMLAFTEGMGIDPSFNEQESELQRTGEALEVKANNYELKTGDVEGAEHMRSMSGWRKYGYMRAKAEQAGASFGAFMSENASNAEYSVNGFTLANAPDSATRQAVAAKMASNYLRPYQGLNKSFMGKYLFPGMQKGMASTVASYTAANNKRIQANRLDSVQQQFLMAEDKSGAMQVMRSEMTAMGYTEPQIRSKMVEMAGQFKSRTHLDSFLDSPYGPNGQRFRDQYPKEAQEAVNAFNTLKTSQASNDSKARKIADLNEKEKAMQAVMQDRKDGSFDANPERLKELAEAARANGYEDTAKYWESQVAETAYMKSSKTLKEQYEKQIAAGIVPQDSEILQNPALSQEDKQALLKKSSGSGKAEPTSDVSKGHKELIKESIKQRGKWSPTKANDPGITAMELKAWSQYKQDYNEALRNNGGDANAASIIAFNNFKKAFSATDGEYKLITPEDVKKDPSLAPRLSTYAGYDPNSVSAVPVSALQQVREKTQGPTAYMTVREALDAPDLFGGEDAQLEALQKSFKTTGVIGAIPPVYYELQQQLGGKVSIMDLVNKRLEANGLEKLPPELNEIIKPVEDSFDDETYAYINYKPNVTRTDIGVISNGGDPIYAQSTAAQEEIKAIFGLRESPQAGYDAMNRGTGGDSPGGGTAQLGRPLTSMTVGEIKQLQATGGVNAVGRYQFIAGTLLEAAEAAGITDDMPFNEAVQDRMFFVHLDRYGAYGPWEQWWIQQGGEHLRLTPAEKQKIEAFREAYDPSKPWRQARNTREDLLHVYTSGNIGPTSTGAHLDVKQVGGGRFEETALDEFVVVHDPEFGDVPLGKIRQLTGGIGDNFDEHVARGSHGIDYGLHSGTKISIKGGAKVVRTVPSIHGDVLTIQVPDGRQFTFIHGTSAK